ncbi:hypothetical protein MSWHS_0320 [Methanosarcina sp. WWM596]|nr:hypothetical protein MSWHS_0320 [Methanosarcina sp. WWM596]AKB20588.1 hypothetical protein MSWH1_0317 [Methanosarcina sp. WH1]
MTPKFASKILNAFIKKQGLKKSAGRKSLSDLKISDPVLPCKNQEKISVGYGIWDDFP